MLLNAVYGGVVREGLTGVIVIFSDRRIVSFEGLKGVLRSC